VLGGFVLSRNRQNPKNITFFFFSISIAVWSFFYLRWQLSATASDALFFCKALMCGAIFIPVFYLHHILSVLGRIKERMILLGLAYFFGLVSLGLCFSPYFVCTVTARFSFLYWPVAGSIFSIFLLIWLGIVVYGAWLIYSHYKKSTGHLRKQLGYMLWATIIGWTGGATNYFLWFNVPVLPFGNALVSVYVMMVSYAILRHRLLDIEVIIRKTLVFAGVSFTVFALFTATSFLITEVLQKKLTGAARLWLFALVGMVVAAVVRPLNDFLLNLTDRYLFQKKYDYAKILQEASQEIALVTGLNELTRKMIAVLVRKARVKNVAIFARSASDVFFSLKGCYGYRSIRPAMVLNTDHPLVVYLSAHPYPVTRVRIESEIAKASAFDRDGAKAAAEWMKQLKAEVAVPSFIGQGEKRSGMKLQGILVMGGKKSDEDYDERDLDMLATLAHEHAVKFENVRLFDTVLAEKESRLKAQSEAKLVSYAKTIGHEIKNALVGIEGPSVFLRKHQVHDLRQMYERYLKDKVPTGAQNKYLDICSKIEKQAGEIFERVQKIRVIASTAQGTLKTDESAFEEIYFKILWDSAKEEASAGRCRYDTSIPENFIIYGNLVLLQRVFVNLLGNSLDAMAGQEEKLVTLRAGYEEKDSKSWAVLRYKDNGPGIPPEILEKIFEQGFSTKPRPASTNINASGHGQGMYVCREIIETIHHGKIEVRSTVGEGTEFLIRLPVQAAAEPENSGEE